MPGLGLRASEEAEVLGMDDAEIGEFAVSPSATRSFEKGSSDSTQYDYVELTRDVVQAIGDSESKYSGEQRSPVEPTEKTFSSTDDTVIKSHR